jgi:hypothetical protein
MKQALSFALAAALAAFLILFTTDRAVAQTAKGKSAQEKAGPAQQWGSFDDDGDGIPNCQDPDYVRPKDGTGKKLGKMHMFKGANGNSGFGPGNGSGNSGIGPRDGTGFGKAAGAGTGVCDGTGPKGKGRGK